jgi:hypothetical protein
METFAWTAMGMRPSKDAPTLFVKEHEVPASMPQTLEDKLATMIWYLSEVRSLRRSADPKAFESYLDDIEVGVWLDQMNKANRIRNTRFTDKR